MDQNLLDRAEQDELDLVSLGALDFRKFSEVFVCCLAKGKAVRCSRNPR